MRDNTKLLPSSTLTSTDENGYDHSVDMLRCCHCGNHFPIQPGSGKTRGFCMNCNGPVCGKGCAVCVPFEQRLENQEQGKPVDHRRVIVPSGLILP